MFCSERLNTFLDIRCINYWVGKYYDLTQQINMEAVRAKGDLNYTF